MIIKVGLPFGAGPNHRRTSGRWISVCEGAPTLDGDIAGATFTPWLRRFFIYFTSKRHVASELIEHSDKDNPVLGAGRPRVLAAGRPLLLAAHDSHEARGDLTLDQILDMVVAVAKIQGDPATSSRSSTQRSTFYGRPTTADPSSRADRSAAPAGRGRVERPVRAGPCGTRATSPLNRSFRSAQRRIVRTTCAGCSRCGRCPACGIGSNRPFGNEAGVRPPVELGCLVRTAHRTAHRGVAAPASKRSIREESANAVKAAAASGRCTSRVGAARRSASVSLCGSAARRARRSGSDRPRPDRRSGSSRSRRPSARPRRSRCRVARRLLPGRA